VKRADDREDSEGQKNDRVSETIEASKNFHGTKMAQKFSETLILQAVYSAYFSLIT
jgi:hypothetical protein